MWIRCKIIALTGFALLSLLVPAASGQQDDKPIVQNTAPGKFQKIPNLPDCITAAVEQGDPTKAASVLMVKGTRGCKAPWDFHTPKEQLMLASGRGRDERKREPPVNLPTGGFAYAPSKHVHQFACLGGPCSFFLRSDAPFVFFFEQKTAYEISPEQAVSKRHK